ncbi:MAG: rhodanese-like domain-containing protein [Planctomycetota bacterium]
MKVRDISTTALRNKLDVHKEVPVVNVLEQEAFDKAHIPTSVHVGLESKDFVDRCEDLVDGDKSREIVVYCASKDCDASPKAAEKLAEAGFENVIDYEGGMKAWQEAGMSVATGGE